MKHPALKILLKLGSQGAAVVTADTAVRGESVTMLFPDVLKSHKIIDTVGAGDCFTGAFVVRHSELDWSDKAKWNENYKESMNFGNSAAFLCITRYGAMPSMPWRKEVDEFRQNLK